MTTPIRALSDRVHAELVAVEPYIRARNGLPLEHLRVETPETWEADAAFARSALAELDALVPESEDDHHTAGYVRHLLGMSIHRAEHQDAGFTVTPYQSYELQMVLGYAFATYDGPAATYLDLVADYRDIVREKRARLVRQREIGALVPRPALAGVRAGLEAKRSAAQATLAARAPSGAEGSPLLDEVTAAYDELIGYLGEDYARDAPEDVCLSHQPGGEDWYRALVHDQTASTLTPEQLHQVGLEQVAELAEKMAELRGRMGFSGSEEEFHAQLATDPRVHTNDHEEVNALFRRHMARLEPLLDDWFGARPAAPYDVQRLDPAHEAGMTYGFYEAPTAADPVGRYRWNGADLETKSLLTYASLIFHELAPGHHFHLARQAENTALPELRRDGGHLAAFNEGWAEYAAGLGWEMGLYDDPLDAYGRLAVERFTAQRLVVDTGLNLVGWSLDRAAAYMLANTTETAAQVASEVLRYSTDLPGQALAYRAGFLELTRLRGKAEALLGERFRVRDFHEHVLAPGALPFPTLDASIERWAARS